MNRRQSLQRLAMGATAALLRHAPAKAQVQAQAQAQAQAQVQVQVQVHGGPGPVSPPAAMPALQVQDQRGRTQPLHAWLTGHVTLVQTIFTGCSSVCPIQGAVFAQLQQSLASRITRVPVRLLSVSIDPLGDTPAALQAWLAKMGASPGWDAVLPQPQDVELLRRALEARPGGTPVGLEAHDQSAFLVDAQALLRWRSTPLPSADGLLRAVEHYAR